MPDKRITQLQEKLTALENNDEIAINDSSTNFDKKTNLDDVGNFIAGYANKGYSGVSLTNFTNTLEPQIAGGSSFEIYDSGNSKIIEVSGSTSITGWAGIGNGNDVYIESDTSGNFSFTTTAGTWDTSKQGFYNSTKRTIAGLYKVNATTYTQKWVYDSKGIKVFGEAGRYVALPQYMELITTLSSAQNISSGTWTKIILDTISVNRISGSSLSSSVITLDSGIYYVTGFISLWSAAGTTALRIRDITSSTTMIVSWLGSPIMLLGEITVVSDSTNIEFQVYSSSTATITHYTPFGGEITKNTKLTITKIV